MNPPHLAIIKILEMSANMFDAVLFGLVNNYFHFLCERESDIVDGRAYCKLREAEKVARKKSRKKSVGAKGGE